MMKYPSHVTLKDVFDESEMMMIHQIGEQTLEHKATIQDAVNSHLEDIRKTNIAWIKRVGDAEKIYSKMAEVTLMVNQQYYGMDLKQQELLQYTKYDEYGSHYDFHLDTIFGGTNPNVRKLTAILLMSDSKDYEGGDLEFYVNSKPTKITQEKGKMIFFPSYILHRVTPITKGKRVSLVNWFGGPKFK